MKKGLVGLLILGHAAALGCGTPQRVNLFAPSEAQSLRLEVTPDYATYTMRNGLVVVLAPEADSNLVTVDVRYFAGALDEPAGKTGVAHLAEHLLYETAATGGGTVGSRIHDATLSYNGFTYFDGTHYTSVAMAEHLETLLSLEAQRMAANCDQLAPELLERERAVVLQELAQRADSQGPMMQLLGALWGPAHRMATSVGGTDVAKLSKEDVCAFVRDHYAPNRAALIVGGAIHSKKTLSLIAKHFDPIARRDLPPILAAPPMPKRQGATAITLPVSEPGVLVTFPLAPQGSAERVRQNQVARIAAAELASMAGKQKDLSSVYRQLGNNRDTVVALGLFGKGRRPDELERMIFDATKKAWNDWTEEGLLAFKMRAATDLLTLHDDAIERGDAIADYCQYTTNSRYHGDDIDVIMQSDLPTLRTATDALFARARASIFHVAKAPGETDIELALAGDRREYVLPHDATRARASSAAPPQIPALRMPQELRMQNGLRVVLVPRPQSPLFEARLIFRGGDADDPAGKAGTAELAAMLLNARSEDLTIADAMIFASTAFTGSTLHASTTDRATMHGVRGVAALASQHLLRLHTVLTRGDYNEEDLRRLHGRAAELRKEADKVKDSDPEVTKERQERNLAVAVRKKLFGDDHPLLRRHTRDLTAISRSDLQAFRTKHYRMNGAVLVIVGGFDSTTIEKELFDMFGAWAPGSAPTTYAEPPPIRPAAGPSYFALDRAERQLQLSLAFAAKPEISNGAARRIAEGVVAARLKTVREHLAATYGLTASYEGVSGGKVLVIDGKVAPDRGADALRAIREALDLDKMDAGALALEVDRARRKALQLMLARAGSTSAITELFADAAANELPLDFERAAASALASVTTDQVREVLRADLDATRLVVAAIGPGAAATLRAAGAPSVVAIK